MHPRSRASLRSMAVVAFVSLIASAARAEDLELHFSPEIASVQNAHPESSCQDLHKSALSGESQAYSISGPLISLDKFGLDWRSSDLLCVQWVTVTLTSEGLVGGKYVYDVKWDEVSALLASPTLYFSDGPRAIYSHVHDRPAEYPPCGLVVGSIPLRDLKAPAHGSVVVQVNAFARDPAGSLRFMELKATGEFSYSP